MVHPLLQNQRRNTKWGWGPKPQGLLPVSPTLQDTSLPEVSTLPQRGPPVGDQEFKDVSPWRAVHTQIRRPHGYKVTSEISDGADGEVTIGLRL